MKSNIRHFTRRSLFYFIFAMGYGAFMAVLGNDGDLSEGLNWFLVGPAAMSLGTQINVLKSEVPLTLGFGSTRKNVFRGIVWCQVLNVLLPTVAMAILAIVLKSKMSPVFMAFATMFLVIFAQSMGALMGIACYKLKGMAAFFVIFMVSIIISCGVVICIIVFKEELAALMVNGIANTGVYVVVAVVLALWGLALMLQRRMVYKYSL